MTPTLLFAKSDLSTFHKRIETAPLKDAWQAIAQRADGLCDEAGPWYLAPGDMDGPSRIQTNLNKVATVSHLYGKRVMMAGEILGFAYQITGNTRYADHGIALLTAAAEALPIDDPRIARSFPGGWGEILRGLALGLDWLGERMTPRQQRLIMDVGAGYIRRTLELLRNPGTWWTPHHNFIGVAVGTAGAMALRIGDEAAESKQWIEESAQGIALWFDKGFDDQGAYFEGTGYAHFGLHNAILFAAALKRAGGRDLFDDPHLRRVPHFYCMSLLPGEAVFDARNDAHYAGLYDPFMLRLARAYADGLARWVWDLTGVGSSPMRIIWANDVAPQSPGDAGEPLAEHFVGRGLCTFRTGWEADDLSFAIEAGPYYATTHNQADKGHVTLYGHGHRWMIDSGYGNNRDPQGVDQTLAHNSILIDGQGQALSGAGLGTHGRIAAYHDEPAYSYALADATQAYNANHRGDPGPGVRHALRHAAFVRPSHDAPAYVALFDDIVKDDQAHDFTWLLHSDAGNRFEAGGDSALVHPGADADAEAAGIKADASGRGVRRWRFTVEREGDYILWSKLRTAGARFGDVCPPLLRVDDGDPLPWYMADVRLWAWDRLNEPGVDQPRRVHLTAGEHTLRLDTLDQPVQVAHLALTADPDAQPPSDGPGDDDGGEVGSGWVFAQSVDDAPAEATQPDGARMRVHFHGPAPARFSDDQFNGHPRLLATFRCVNLELATILLPLPGPVAEPRVAFDSTDDGLRVTVTWPGREDEIFWPSQAPRRPVIRCTAAAEKA